VTVTSNRDTRARDWLSPRGRQTPSSNPSNDGALLVTNGGSPPRKVHLDEFGFALQGNFVACRYCAIAGAYRDWPQWKRIEHYEREHNRQVVAAKRAATRAARTRRELDSAAAALDMFRGLHGRAPTSMELAEFTKRLGGEPLDASVRRRRQRHRSRGWEAAHELRACRECGGVFAPATARQVFCSPKCRKRYAYQQPRRDAKRIDALPSWWRQTTSRTPNDGGRLLVTKGGSPPAECARCGETFAPRRTDQQFCSNACRQAAYRKRKGTTT
jgi:predicted nucleic acid-binding Zn ribbon protein